MRLIIVGDGVAGRWLSKTAVEAGHEVVVLSDGQPSADTAALAMLRPSYLDKEERSLLLPSLDAWEAAGIEVVRGATVTRWNDDSVKEQADWFAIEPRLPEVEVAERVRGRASVVEPNLAWVGSKHFIGDAVIRCDGSGGGRRTYGSTWVNEDREELRIDGSFAVHHVAPYKALAGVKYGNHARFGSSSAADLNKAIEQADKFFKVALELGWIGGTGHGWHRIDGTRLLRDRYLSHDHLGWRWSGFHRNGFGLVPALAGEVLSTVEALL